ncbi:MAG: TM2 domain-containing protein [Candidatus Yanofskybacteria bacterium]|nr:TM2 domain-containing protein [Candidatus Yanofskybacteria bacterium]
METKNFEQIGKKRKVALILAIFIGGAERIYIGKTYSGIVKLFLSIFMVLMRHSPYFGLLWIVVVGWWLLDIISISRGTMGDKQGRNLIK